MKQGKVHIGTSGWFYEHWIGPFYPESLSRKKFLPYYMQHLDSVEINRTFYSLPKKKVFEEYAGLAARPFIFSVKASQFITHMKRLSNPRQPLRKLLGRLEGLGKHLGPILFQLPPNWKVNLERLEEFLKALPKGHRYAFEFRDPSWINDEVIALLKHYLAAFCIYEFDDYLSPCFVTANFVYIRLHGPNGAYAGNYSHKKLQKWARFIRKQIRAGKDAYCYFDNDEAGYAADNAISLAKILKRPHKLPSPLRQKQR